MAEFRATEQHVLFVAAAPALVDVDPVGFEQAGRNGGVLGELQGHGVNVATLRAATSSGTPSQIIGWGLNGTPAA